jgi:hypothetical protein
MFNKEELERFAALCAVLDTDEGAARVRAAAGVNEAEWMAVRARWLPVLASGNAPDLAACFATAYARACRATTIADHTLELAPHAQQPHAALPFRPLAGRVDGDGAGATQVVPPGAVPPAAPLPFAAAAPVARQRLVRFDPQTGRPLPEPVWVDAPEPPRS